MSALRFCGESNYARRTHRVGLCERSRAEVLAFRQPGKHFGTKQLLGAFSCRSDPDEERHLGFVDVKRVERGYGEGDGEQFVQTSADDEKVLTRIRLQHGLQLCLGIFEAGDKVVEVPLLGEDGQHLARDATGFGESHKGIEDGKGDSPPDFVTDGGIAADDREEALERSRQDDKVAVLERTASRLARARATDR